MIQARDYFRNDERWQYQSFDMIAVGACMLAPAIMWVAEMSHKDDLAWHRGSISSYHDVIPAGAFFIPLTIAVMLFVVNGWLYQGHRIHVAMSAYLFGVIVFDHNGYSAIAHFAFAGYFFTVGAFLEAARDKVVEDWSPRRWLAMAAILPFWMVIKRRREIAGMWPRAAEILLPFLVLGPLSLLGGWLDDHWLFIAEWIALDVLVLHYLGDARTHARDRSAPAAS